MPSGSNPNSWEWPGFLHKSQLTHKPDHHHSCQRLHPFLTLSLALQVKNLQRLESAFRSMTFSDFSAGFFKISCSTSFCHQFNLLLPPQFQADKTWFFWMHCSMFGPSAQIHHCRDHLVTALIFLVHKSWSAMGGKGLRSRKQIWRTQTQIDLSCHLCNRSMVSFATGWGS